MVEIKLKEIAGFIIAVIILTSGITYYIQETGKYKTCSGGWILREDGMYNCPTRNIEAQWCHHGSDEGYENIGYRCYLGEVIDILEPSQLEEIEVFANGMNYVCKVNNKRVDSYTKCYSGIYEAYLGELI